MGWTKEQVKEHIAGIEARITDEKEVGFVDWQRCFDYVQYLLLAKAVWLRICKALLQSEGP